MAENCYVWIMSKCLFNVKIVLCFIYVYLIIFSINSNSVNVNINVIYFTSLFSLFFLSWILNILFFFLPIKSSFISHLPSLTSSSFSHPPLYRFFPSCSFFIPSFTSSFSSSDSSRKMEKGDMGKRRKIRQKSKE